MTKRVLQHQLEDLSRFKFNLAIPKNWVCRDKDKDYGIDVEVEIFDEDGRTTGLVFWVQLKATESNEDSTIKKIDLSIESIKYYLSLEIPVLIARYSEKQDTFYFIWAAEVDLFYAKKKAKTIRISFNENNIYDKDSPLKVKEHLEKIRAIKNGRLKLPIPVYIDIRNSAVNKTPKGIFATSFRLALHEYPDLAVFRNNPKDALLFITLHGDEMGVNLSSLGGCTFHNIKSRAHRGLAEGIAADSLIGCAIALAQVGQSEMAARIVLDKRLKPRFIHNKEIIIHLIPYLLRTSYFEETMDTITDIISSEEDNIIELAILIGSLFESNKYDEKKSSKIEGFLQACLKKYLAIGELSLIGTSYYNLGNHYLNMNLFQKSIWHYLKARKYEKKYLEQSYYFEELAGAFFLHGKYCFASILYSLSLDKGANKNIKRLYADSLMHMGKYQLSVDVFTEYLKESEDGNDDEWHLKILCLERLIENKGIKEQTRHEKEALELISNITAGEKTYVESLEKALELDMLCSLAWFNLGIEHSRTGHQEDAIFDFTICALVKTGDIEAWANAAICCFSEKNQNEILFFILRTGYFFNGDYFLEKLYQEFNNRSNLDICGQLADMIEKILPKSKNDVNSPTVRLKDKDGIFRNILKREDDEFN